MPITTPAAHGRHVVSPDDIAELLNDMRAVFARFIVLDELQLDTVALWAAHTFIYRNDCRAGTGTAS